MFWFDFNWQIQSFLNQFWWQINFLLLVILVILAYLSYKKPIYAIGLTTILLPTYLFRSQIWFIPVTFLELCILVTFFGWLVKQFTVNRQPLIEAKRLAVIGYRLPIILILLASTISVFVAPDRTAAAGLWKAYFVEPILFFLVLINVLKTEQDKKTVLWALGISTLAISLLAIWQKLTGFGIAEASWMAPAHRRVTSIFTSPNAVGLYLGPILAIYFGWLVSELPKVRLANRTFWLVILKLLITIPAILAVLFTVSQGTWLGLAAAIIFLAFFACPPKPDLPSEVQETKEGGRRWGWNKKLTTIIVLTAIIACLLIPLSRHQILELVTFQDASGQNRLMLLQISQKYLITNFKNFIFGAGILGFAQVQDQVREPLTMEALLYPHNIFLNFWLEIGLLGLISFIWLIIKFLKTGFGPSRRRIDVNSPSADWLKLGILAAMITIIVHGLIDVPYFKNDLAVLFWLIIGLL